jgi:transcriptional regulator GlxA family with amidase domain
MIDVLIVVPPRSLLLDVAGPAEAFRLANQQLERQGEAGRFRLRFAGPRAEATTSVGLPLAQLEPLPKTLPRPTWLRRDMRPLLAAPGTPHRLLTVCAGTLMAARAGLLERQRCTTHHEYLDMLRTLAPAAEVVDNRVFVVDGRIASSAGVTAGIDLALHLIADTCGDALAAAVAKTMVVYLRRTPQDPELSPLLAHRHHLHPALHRAQDAVCERPDAEWTLESLADAAHVTSRHLLRLFAEHATVSPMVYVEKIRLERARQALQRGASVTRAAEAAGFSSDLQLRRAWTRHYSGTPRKARAFDTSG